MANLPYSMLMSLDGYTEDEHGKFGWRRGARASLASVRVPVTRLRRFPATCMPVAVALLLLIPAQLPAQQAPRLLYIYRDSLKSGVDSAYGAIEDHAAQVCVDLECPNPYLGLESLSGPHEAWWVNAFATGADTTRVGNAYVANRPLMEALGAVASHKAPLVGTPIQGYAVHRPDLSRGPAWSIAGARFMVVAVTRSRRPAAGSVWEAADARLYVFRPVRTRRQAEGLAGELGGRVFALRPNWSMPAPEWVQADPDFWRHAPAPRPSRDLEAR